MNNLISNARQIIAENFYLVTEELCHKSFSEMFYTPINKIKEVALKADALIQALFKEEIRDEIVTTLKETYKPIHGVIIQIPKHKLTKYILCGIVGFSISAARFGTASMLSSWGVNLTLATGSISLICEMASKFNNTINADISFDEAARKFFHASLVYGLTAINTNIATPTLSEEIDFNFKTLFIYNFAQGVIFSLSVTIPAIIYENIDLSTLKETIPNIVSTYKKNLKSLYCYIKYKNEDRILKDVDTRMISAFENNVAEIIHDYVGIKKKSINPLHVNIKNYIKEILNKDIVLDDAWVF